MNGKYFDDRALSCSYWDGHTNYRVTKESLMQQNARIDDFGKWLESNIDNMATEAFEDEDGEEEDDADEHVDGDKTPSIEDEN